MEYSPGVEGQDLVGLEAAKFFKSMLTEGNIVLDEGLRRKHPCIGGG